MRKGTEAGKVEVRIAVLVQVDSSDTELLDRMSQSDPSPAVSDVVRSEIQSNLESLSYVQQVKTAYVKGAES